MTRLLAVVLGVAALATLASCGRKPGDPTNFGREVVVSARMPRDVVEKFNAFVPPPRKPGDTAIEAMTEEGVAWPLPRVVSVSPDGSPYVVAIRVTGKVTGADGAVRPVRARCPCWQVVPSCGRGAPGAGGRSPNSGGTTRGSSWSGPS